MLLRSLCRGFFVGAVALSMGVVACSGSSSSISGGSCSHLYSALQSFYMRCNLGSFYLTSQMDRATKSCEQTLGAPGSTTTNGDLDSCASQIEKIPCNSSKALDALTSCTKPGSVPVGGPCSSGIQCQSSQCSVTSSDMCGTCQATSKEGEPCNPMLRCTIGLVCSAPTAGTCAKPVYNPAGAACDSIVQRCDDNLRCDSMTKKCVPYATSGGACMSTTECGTSLVCSAQKCVDPPGQGGDCSMTYRCGSNLICDITGTKTCVPLTFAKGGQPCSNVNLCEATLSCPTSKVCPMVIADGQPCTAGDMNATCDYAARCIDGKCSFGVPTCK